MVKEPHQSIRRLGEEAIGICDREHTKQAVGTELAILSQSRNERRGRERSSYKRFSSQTRGSPTRGSPPKQSYLLQENSERTSGRESGSRCNFFFKLHIRKSIQIKFNILIK